MGGLVGGSVHLRLCFFFWGGAVTIRLSSRLFVVLGDVWEFLIALLAVCGGFEVFGECLFLRFAVLGLLRETSRHHF